MNVSSMSLQGYRASALGSTATPPFGGSSIPGCVSYDDSGDCETCSTASGWTLNSGGSCDGGTVPSPTVLTSTLPDVNGVTKQMCDNAGRPWVNGLCMLNKPAPGTASPTTMYVFLAVAVGVVFLVRS